MLKKKWNKPKLIILVRKDQGESVLQVCKFIPSIPGFSEISTSNSNCYSTRRDAFTCIGQCNDIATS